MGLTRRKAVYYFQKRIPQDLIEAMGKSKLLYSLGTKDRVEATKLEAIERTKWEAHFALLRGQASAVDNITENDIQAIAISGANALLEECQRAYSQQTALVANGEGVSENTYLDDLSYHLESYQSALIEGRYGPHIRAEVNDLLTKSHLPPQLPEALWYRLAREYCQHAHRLLTTFIQSTLEPWKYVAVKPLEAPELTSSIVSLGDAITAFIEDKGDVGYKQRDKYTTAFEVLLGLVSEDKPLKEITRSDIRELRDTLRYFPANVRKHPKTRDLGIDEVIVMAKDNKLTELKPLAVTTINARLGIVSSMFKFAIREQWVQTNPCDGLTLKDASKAKDKRLPYSTELLKRLLNTCGGDSRFKWPVLISLTMGLRMNELLQLTRQDLITEAGVYCLSVNEQGGKRVKTASSIRVVPIPQVLLNMGLVEWIRQQAGDLFPVEASKSGYKSDVYSKRYAYFCKRNGLVQDKVTFHSLVVVK